jgi:ArsR family transcriptional regulator, arsenate/arsenite/antimonite-responsive transcriptional repressor / arsenate reductase (thioredoxin)
MSTEEPTEVRARRHAALGEPLRLAIAESLLLGDRSPADLAGEWDVRSNLLAHHIHTLVTAGLVRRVASEADRRRTYLRLTPLGRTMVLPAPAAAVGRVVFVCTHNSARSQFAEGLWRQHSRIPVASAGTHPADRVHPMAVRVARRHGLDLAHARPKTVASVVAADDFIVTVCDAADRELTPQDIRHRHWSIPDPVAQETPASFEHAFTAVADAITTVSPLLQPPGTIAMGDSDA